MLEIEQFIALAKGRNQLIPTVISENRVYTPAEPPKSFLAMSLCSVFISGLEVIGTKYLEEAAGLVNGGKKLMIVSNHQSDADHTIRRYICEKLGFKELSDTFFFLGGLKMIERKSIERLMPAENTVFVLTPADVHNLVTALRWSKRQQLTPEQVRIVDEYKNNCQALSVASSAAIEKQIELGKTLVFYPEGTRTRDTQGRIMRASKEVTKLITHDEETYIFPIMVDGTAKIMTLDDKFNPDRTRLKMVVGEPYPSREIFEVDTRGIFLNGSPATPADVVMARLSILMPELVSSESAEFYENVRGTYNPRLSLNGRYYSTSVYDRFEHTFLKKLFQRLLAKGLQYAQLTSG